MQSKQRQLLTQMNADFADSRGFFRQETIVLDLRAPVNQRLSA